MSNHTTGAQRYNARMDKIFEKAKAEGRGLNGMIGNSHTKGHGVNSPAMSKAKALGKAKEVKESIKNSHKRVGGTIGTFANID